MSAPFTLRQARIAEIAAPKRQPAAAHAARHSDGASRHLSEAQLARPPALAAFGRRLEPLSNRCGDDTASADRNHNAPNAWDFSAIPIVPREVTGRGSTAPAYPARIVQARWEGIADNDPLERQAERVAEEVISMPGPGTPPGSVLPCAAGNDAAKAKQQTAFRLPAGSAAASMERARKSVHEALRSPGQPMDASTRAHFEPRFGRDLSRVRLHTGAVAEGSARDINAQAYTAGDDIVFGAGRFAPGTADGRRLLAHELAHVVQQSPAAAEPSNGTPASPPSPARFIQRKLLVTADSEPKRVQALFDLLEPASGLTLAYDRKSQEVSISGFRELAGPMPAAGPTAAAALPSLARGTPSSPSLAIGLQEIIEDPHQDAVLKLGGPRPGVSFGEFPQSGPLIQVIDIDDLVRLDTGAPGSGVATLFHEIVENFRAHAPDQPGLDPSHEAGLAAEARVAGELVSPGERVAEALVDKGKGVVRWVRDYERYFLVYDRGPPDNIVLGAWQAARVNVGVFTINGFAPGSDAVPASAQSPIEAVANAMRLSPAATVRIDCGGADPHLALRRGQRIQDAILDNGKNRNLYGFDLRGPQNFNLVATGASDERMVITVDQPDTEVAGLRGSIVRRVLGAASTRRADRVSAPGSTSS